MPGAQELIIILVIVVFLFGASKLPALSRSLGTSIKEFRKATNELDDDTADDGKPTVSQPPKGA